MGEHPGDGWLPSLEEWMTVLGMVGSGTNYGYSRISRVIWEFLGYILLYQAISGYAGLSGNILSFFEITRAISGSIRQALASSSYVLLSQAIMGY